ncbi:hypothetical protein ZWY2020_017636 [Hordeum vulgare]|nr:hypothetical protein ZWY2020_017636 [Hordeum vulgare]
MQVAVVVHQQHLLTTSSLGGRASRRPSTVRMALHADRPSVAIVGAIGAMGQEFLRIITPVTSPTAACASSPASAPRASASSSRARGIRGVDIALFRCGNIVSRAHTPVAVAVASGPFIVDNSSAYRIDPDVQLVIPEINPKAMADVRLGKGAIVANPNCSTIMCLMAITSLHRHTKVPLLGTNVALRPMLSSNTNT